MESVFSGISRGLQYRDQMDERARQRRIQDLQLQQQQEDRDYQISRRPAQERLQEIGLQSAEQGLMENRELYPIRKQSAELGLSNAQQMAPIQRRQSEVGLATAELGLSNAQQMAPLALKQSELNVNLLQDKINKQQQADSMIRNSQFFDALSTDTPVDELRQMFPDVLKSLGLADIRPNTAIGGYDLVTGTGERRTVKSADLKQRARQLRMSAVTLINPSAIGKIESDTAKANIANLRQQADNLRGQMQTAQTLYAAISKANPSDPRLRVLSARVRTLAENIDRITAAIGTSVGVPVSSDAIQSQIAQNDTMIAGLESDSMPAPGEPWWKFGPLNNASRMEYAEQLKKENEMLRGGEMAQEGDIATGPNGEKGIVRNGKLVPYNEDGQ